MKLDLRIVGRNSEEIILGLKQMLKELESGRCNSNCFSPIYLDNEGHQILGAEIDFEFTSSNDVFNLEDEIVIDPYTQE